MAAMRAVMLAMQSNAAQLGTSLSHGAASSAATTASAALES